MRAEPTVPAARVTLRAVGDLANGVSAASFVAGPLDHILQMGVVRCHPGQRIPATRDRGGLDDLRYGGRRVAHTVPLQPVEPGPQRGSGPRRGCGCTRARLRDPSVRRWTCPDRYAVPMAQRIRNRLSQEGQERRTAALPCAGEARACLLHESAGVFLWVSTKRSCPTAVARRRVATCSAVRPDAYRRSASASVPLGVSLRSEVAHPRASARRRTLRACGMCLPCSQFMTTRYVTPRRSARTCGVGSRFSTDLGTRESNGPARSTVRRVSAHSDQRC